MGAQASCRGFPTLSEWEGYLSAGNCTQSVQQATLMVYPPLSSHITVPEAWSDLVSVYPTQLCLLPAGKLQWGADGR